MNRVLVAACFCAGGCAALPRGSNGEWNTPVYGPHVLVAVLDSTHVQESSGLLASRRNPDVLWTHNDSGGPRVWAMRLSAADLAAGAAHDLGYVELAGAADGDWEDIAAGPGQTIYILDGGDNPPCDRADKQIHRFVEPALDSVGAPVRLRVPHESIRFEYPDSVDSSLPADEERERFDAECLLVHPQSGDIYIVTKRDTSDRGVARVYRLEGGDVAWASPAVHVLQFVADLTGVLGVTDNVVSTVTAGDVGPEGRRVVIRRYGVGFEFVLPPKRPFAAVFKQSPTSLPLPGEIQGEGICYSRDGRDIYTSGEVKFLGSLPLGPTRCPIYRTAGVPATRPAVRPDFDADGDVDQEDFSHFQECLTGPGLPQTDISCRDALLDGDGDVDAEDFNVLQVCFGGPNAPVSVHCATAP